MHRPYRATRNRIVLLSITFLMLFARSQMAFSVPMTFSLTGELDNRGAAQLIEFDVSAVLRPRDVTFETFASDGGMNAASRVYNPPEVDVGATGMDEISEGFQPKLWLFDSGGMAITQFFSGEPMDMKAGTDLLIELLLGPGTYTLALTNEANRNSDELTDGFGPPDPSRDFQRGPFTNNGPLWAVDISGIEDARIIPGGSSNTQSVSLPLVAAVPEPLSGSLLLIGLLAIVLKSRVVGFLSRPRCENR